MKEWESIEKTKQVAFYLGLSESIISLLSKSEFYEDARKALNLCWEWFETKQISGDEIYTLLDDGTEDNGLFIQMQMDEDEENTSIWECIVAAVSFVDKQAYESENELYLPSPIENVDDSLLSHFLENYSLINMTNKIEVEEFFNYLRSLEIYNKNDVMSFFVDSKKEI